MFDSQAGHRLTAYLREDWREFAIVVTITVILMMLIRIVIYRGIIAEAQRKKHGWFEVLCVGCDLCLLALGGLFVFSRLLDRGAVQGQYEGTTVYVVTTVTLLLMAAVIASFSHRQVARLVFSLDSLFAMHIPNALGVVTLFLVIALMRG